MFTPQQVKLFVLVFTASAALVLLGFFLKDTIDRSEKICSYVQDSTQSPPRLSCWIEYSLD